MGALTSKLRSNVKELKRKRPTVRKHRTRSKRTPSGGGAAGPSSRPVPTAGVSTVPNTMTQLWDEVQRLKTALTGFNDHMAERLDIQKRAWEAESALRQCQWEQEMGQLHREKEALRREKDECQAEIQRLLRENTSILESKGQLERDVKMLKSENEKHLDTKRSLVLDMAVALTDLETEKKAKKELEGRIERIVEHSEECEVAFRDCNEKFRKHLKRGIEQEEKFLAKERELIVKLNEEKGKRVEAERKLKLAHSRRSNIQQVPNAIPIDHESRHANEHGRVRDNAMEFKENNGIVGNELCGGGTRGAEWSKWGIEEQ